MAAMRIPTLRLVAEPMRALLLLLVVLERFASLRRVFNPPTTYSPASRG